MGFFQSEVPPVIIQSSWMTMTTSIETNGDDWDPLV